MFATIIEIALMVLVLVGVAYEEKLIAFEDRISDALANAIAKVIVAHRRKKYEQERAAKAQRAAQARRSKMHLVNEASLGNEAPHLYIA